MCIYLPLTLFADTDLSPIPLLEADVLDPGSLLAAAGRARVLLNCTGPYTLLGAPVVRACIAARTHYVDITAELHVGHYGSPLLDVGM